MRFYCNICQHSVEGIRKDIGSQDIFEEKVICLECGTSYVIKNDDAFKILNGLTHHDEIDRIVLGNNKCSNRTLHLYRTK